MCILHRTFHYQMSQRGWLPESALSSSSFFPSRSSISTPFPFLPSTSVLIAKKRRRALHQLSGPSARWDPTLPLSLSALSSSLLLSSPCCDRAHLLDLGYTRSESNYLAATSQSHPLTGFLGVELTSPLFALILLRTGRRTLISKCLCIMKTLSFCSLSVVLYQWHAYAFFLSCICLFYSFTYSGHVSKSCSHSSAMRDHNVQSNLHTALWGGREGGVVVQLMLVPRRSANQTYSCSSFWKLSAFRAPFVSRGLTDDLFVFVLLFFLDGECIPQACLVFWKTHLWGQHKERAGGGSRIFRFFCYSFKLVSSRLHGKPNVSH